MAPRNSNRISLRTGTDLTYNIRKGDEILQSRTIKDVEYIRPEGNNIYLAISLKTGVTALGETDEQAYSSLIFKLYSYLMHAISDDNVEIGEEVSEKVKKESESGKRMPLPRQERALRNGIKEFIEFHKSNGKELDFQLTTENLEETQILAIIYDTESVPS